MACCYMLYVTFYVIVCHFKCLFVIACHLLSLFVVLYHLLSREYVALICKFFM